MSNTGLSGTAIDLTLAAPVAFGAELVGEWATAELGIGEAQSYRRSAVSA